MNVAVTGGSGVVGRSLVRHLVAAGHQVVAQARSARSSELVTSLGAQPVMGDVLDRHSLRALVSGAEWVFHVAGVNELCSADPGHMDLVNIEGSRNVFMACNEAGVRRMVHTSSAATIGEARGTIGTESSPHRGSYLSRYERSKHIAERLVLETVGDLEVVAVNPSSVQGPGRATGTGKLILNLLNGKLPFVVETTVSIVDIDDCVRGHLLAAANGVSGARYILSGASFGMAEGIDLLASMSGRRSRTAFLPGWVAAGGAAAFEFGARLAGRRPTLCREMVRVLRAGHTYDGTRATRELGLEYTALDVTIRRTIDWFESEGLLS